MTTFFIETIYLFILVVIPTERSEWRNLFKDVSTMLDMTIVITKGNYQKDNVRHEFQQPFYIGRCGVCLYLPFLLQI